MDPWVNRTVNFTMPHDGVDYKSMTHPPPPLYWVLRKVFALIGRIPSSSRAKTAGFLGGVIYHLARRHRRIAITNLRKAFGSQKTIAQCQLITRNVFNNLIRIILEIGWAQELPESQFNHHFKISGARTYRQALSKGKGVLMLCAHFGNWELLPMIAHMVQMPLSIVYRPLDAHFLDYFFNSSRSRFGAKTISKRRGAMRRILRDLKQNRAVAMLMDQSVDWYEGVFVDFFNQPTCTNTGLAIIAIKTRAPVVPCFLVRTATGFHAFFGPELPLIQTGDRTKDIEANTQMYNRVIEAYARRFPDQWFWVHRRWKTQPMSAWPNPERRQRWMAQAKGNPAR